MIRVEIIDEGVIEVKVSPDWFLSHRSPYDEGIVYIVMDMIKSFLPPSPRFLHVYPLKSTLTYNHEGGCRDFMARYRIALRQEATTQLAEKVYARLVAWRLEDYNWKDLNE